MNFEQIADIFSRQGYVWNFTDGRRIPTTEEIQKTFFVAVDALASEPDNAQIEVGRMIIKKKGQWYDLYLHLAEFQ